jgi:hypothetical protein
MDVYHTYFGRFQNYDVGRNDSRRECEDGEERTFTVRLVLDKAVPVMLYACGTSTTVPQHLIQYEG